MLSSRLQDDLLSPHDAIASRWGRGKLSSTTVEDCLPYFELEECPTFAQQLDEVEEILGDVSELLPDSPLSTAFAVDTSFNQMTRQSSYASNRSSSIWSIQSVLTAITTPSLSRRTSWIGSIKTSSLRSPTPILRSLNKELPTEILACVLQHLRAVHEDTRSTTCSSCFNNDAFNLALVSRAWDKAVRHELYRNIYLDGLTSPSKRMKTRPTTRLALLRRTLRDRATLAKLVYELRIWDPNGDFAGDTLDQIASVIMVCPNLQRFSGTQPFYSHQYSRLHHALSTRKQLESHMWIIGSLNRVSDTPPVEQSLQFLDLHRNWQNLRCLALRCQRGAELNSNVFHQLTNILPALSQLSISGFPSECFNDETLLALRSLQSLRLADLPGLTDRGLSRFSNSSAAQSLTNLSIISINITSLYTISRLLSNLPLTKFTLTQYLPLTLPCDELIIQPLLASSTLQFLHWETPLTGRKLSLATTHLASSIQHYGFPNLHHLRCPIDTIDGTMQSLCKPQIPPSEIPSMSAAQITGSSLRAARMRAQARTSAGIRGDMGSAVVVRVTDPEGEVEEEFEVSWMGYTGYDINISYELYSDVGIWEQRRILVEEGDLLGDVLGSSSAGTGCTGKSGRKHSERQRWMGMGVERLF